MLDRQEKMQMLGNVIEQALHSYRMSGMQDKDGDGYSLLDHMSVEGKTIDSGRREIEFLVDHILGYLLPPENPTMLTDVESRLLALEMAMKETSKEKKKMYEAKALGTAEVSDIPRTQKLIEDIRNKSGTLAFEDDLIFLCRELEREANAGINTLTELAERRAERKEWAGLTEDEQAAIYNADGQRSEMVRKVEAKLKEKNA